MVRVGRGALGGLRGCLLRKEVDQVSGVAMGVFLWDIDMGFFTKTIQEELVCSLVAFINGGEWFCTFKCADIDMYSLYMRRTKCCA